MNLQVFLLGLAKLVFAGCVAGAGVLIGVRLLKRFLKIQADEALAAANVAVGVVKAGSIVALALLARAAVLATFDAVDLLMQGPKVPWMLLVQVGAFALLHLVFTLAVGVGLLWLSIFVFNRVTPGVDELAEVQKGNVAAGLVLAAIVVVIALLASPALQAALSGLLPYPSVPERFPS